MPEPLKNLYTRELIGSLCIKIQSAHSDFNAEKFTQCVFNNEWKNKELKARMRHITLSLHQFLPDNYRKAIKILKQVSPHFNGFEYMFFPEYVELYGMDDVEFSMEALAFFTGNSSSEFAVRPYIKKNKTKMMRQMSQWADSENHHIRRLASEGCRPRLPWAMALPEFKKDPKLILPILNKIKNDESEYVRRSVANNLNDIAKDNPEIVIKTAKKWLGNNQNLDKLVKHACRSLLKQGEPQVMNLFGFVPPDKINISGFTVQKTVGFGQRLEFKFNLKSKKKSLGKIRLEYAVDFMKSNGKLSRKVFKISEANITENMKSVVKSHSFKKISARKYYPGQHELAIIVNGHELVSKKFKLIEEKI